jgi:mannose-6-phosphate isomerase-like protein (cupin superfamily)
MSSRHDHESCDPRHRIRLRARWRRPRRCPRSAKRKPRDLGTIDGAQALAGDPSKEVNAQVYTFPPGAVLPWQIHPDAHEIAYVVEGTSPSSGKARR